ncbi:ATP-dependent helicase HrpB [Rhodobium gokarnense]|uniref:ATP-dependent helicase HrpB n=1 Tax=Rhodobium gokarnense TaxID=364296 RepID=A0ABT3H7Y9_9HYPH|nr:ATP-dependent helicase HrpB [Rhodobium gokarnense]MCW2306504.1 ATP-dependent helicase HrpB [Rhodobium gokarnense]
MTLPIESALPELLKSLSERPDAVLVAPPGAGKTTRVPLALLDADWRGDGRIVVLEPRRLAARAAARRMASMLGEEVGERVGYRVRMESRVSKRTCIEVVTEGVFTRRILADPELSGVAAVLFDEFHERSLDGDTGLALAMEAREALSPDLRLLVMSATIDGARVAALLGEAPVIDCPGRSFPVETRYLGRDPLKRIEDEAAAAVRKALREETGSVLVFLPGQGEIERTADRLGEAVPETVDLCPLYGALRPADQDRAIRPAEAGRRKVVLATAIAETSLTIEGVRVVIDCGLARKPVYEPANGLTRLETTRVSRAAADQRRGRAGRLEPGICYRLWEEGQTAALQPFDRPEVLEADLAGLVLDLAAWGTSDPASLQWLDPPPKPAWTEAVALLKSLDALDGDGRLTDAGKAIADLPLHPRLAHMVARAAETGEALLAAEIAVLVSERGLGGTDVDLTDRLRRLRLEKGRAASARKLAEGWARRAGGALRKGDPADAGRLLAIAYPDRIAQARGAHGHFRLANGRGGRLDETHPLAGTPFFAVAELQGAAKSARITLAAPLSLADIEADFADRIETTVDVAFDRGARAVRARRRRRLDSLVLDETPEPNPDPEAVTAALLGGIKGLGLACLPWTAKLERLRGRIAFLHARDPQSWPDVSDDALTGTLDTWLGPFIAGKSALADISSGDLHAAFDVLAPRAMLDRLAPEEISLPTGRTAPVDYGAEAGPTLSVRPQELFGLDTHPVLAGTPVVIELLSPAGRPIQLTRDLPGFWRGSWADVRRDMRGRYPKHPWPEDPRTADPTTRAKPRK